MIVEFTQDIRNLNGQLERRQGELAGFEPKQAQEYIDKKIAIPYKDPVIDDEVNNRYMNRMMKTRR